MCYSCLRVPHSHMPNRCVAREPLRDHPACGVGWHLVYPERWWPGRPPWAEAETPFVPQPCLPPWGRQRSARLAPPHPRGPRLRRGTWPALSSLDPTDQELPEGGPGSVPAPRLLSELRKDRRRLLPKGQLPGPFREEVVWTVPPPLSLVSMDRKLTLLPRQGQARSALPAVAGKQVRRRCLPPLCSGEAAPGAVSPSRLPPQLRQRRSLSCPRNLIHDPGGSAGSAPGRPGSDSSGRLGGSPQGGGGGAGGAERPGEPGESSCDGPPLGRLLCLRDVAQRSEPTGLGWRRAGGHTALGVVRGEEMRTSPEHRRTAFPDQPGQEQPGGGPRV